MMFIKSPPERSRLRRFGGGAGTCASPASGRRLYGELVFLLDIRLEALLPSPCFGGGGVSL